MKTGPRISIVTPTYNSAAYLAATLESVRAQTFTDWELIVFDDGSSDSSVEEATRLARQDSRIRVVAGNHGGIASARNQGFQHTDPQSEFIAFLDSDDMWEPEALALLVDALDRHPECVAAHGLARAINPEGRRIEDDNLTEWMRYRREIRDGRYVDLPLTAPTSFQTILLDNYLVTPGTSLVRRRVLESVGGFAPTLAVCEDWDMNVRIARHGGFVLVDRVILNWRRHPDSSSAVAHGRWRKAAFAAWKRVILSAENTPEQRRAIEFAVLRRCHQYLTEAGQMLMQGRVQRAARSLLYAWLYILAYFRSHLVKLHV